MYAVHKEMEDSLEQSDQPPPSVTIQGRATEHHIYLADQANSVLKFLHIEQSEVSVLIVDDEAMSAIHLKHSGIEETTDVLTFDNGSDEHAVRADIAICADVAFREAKKRNNSIQNELLLYILHGMLHCSGFDDHDDESHRNMHAEEDRVLEAIGVGAVWSNGS
jgi:probable rRNA maturation factor